MFLCSTHSHFLVPISLQALLGLFMENVYKFLNELLSFLGALLREIKRSDARTVLPLSWRQTVFVFFVAPFRQGP